MATADRFQKVTTMATNLALTHAISRHLSARQLAALRKHPREWQKSQARSTQRMADMDHFFALARARAGFGSLDDIEIALRHRLPKLNINVEHASAGDVLVEFTTCRGTRRMIAVDRTSLKSFDRLTACIIGFAYGPDFSAAPE